MPIHSNKFRYILQKIILFLTSFVYINQKLILKVSQLVLSTFFQNSTPHFFTYIHDLIIRNPNVSRMKSFELSMFHHFCPITSSDIDFFPHMSPWFPPEIHTCPYVFPWFSPLLPVANPSPPAPQQPLREVEDIARELNTRCVAGALTEGAAGGTSRLRDLQNYRCKIDLQLGFCSHQSIAGISGCSST